jgi:hypothetical protein
MLRHGIKGENMKRLRMLVLVSAAVVTAGGAQTTSAAVNHDSCLSVNARAVGQNLGHGRTEATITHAGILNGTTTGQLEITGGTPPILTVVGTGVLTTDHGTLTVSVVGTFNAATGMFEATGQVVHGTGVFAGATGTLTFVGVEDLTSGRFTQTITGTVCLAHG